MPGTVHWVPCGGPDGRGRSGPGHSHCTCRHSRHYTADRRHLSTWHKQFQGHFETIHELKIGPIIYCQISSVSQQSFSLTAMDKGCIASTLFFSWWPPTKYTMTYETSASSQLWAQQIIWVAPLIADPPPTVRSSAPICSSLISTMFSEPILRQSHPNWQRQMYRKEFSVQFLGPS